MPSPIDTLLRTHVSPVPTQTVFGLPGSMATARIDWTSWLSKTGVKVDPPFTDFHTPPLAAPTKTVRRPLSATAVTADTRPLISAEPMLRAERPEMVPASRRAGPAGGGGGAWGALAAPDAAAGG